MKLRILISAWIIFKIKNFFQFISFLISGKRPFPLGSNTQNGLAEVFLCRCSCLTGLDIDSDRIGPAVPLDLPDVVGRGRGYRLLPAPTCTLRNSVGSRSSINPRDVARNDCFELVSPQAQLLPNLAPFDVSGLLGSDRSDYWPSDHLRNCLVRANALCFHHQERHVYAWAHLRPPDLLLHLVEWTSPLALYPCHPSNRI